MLIVLVILMLFIVTIPAAAILRFLDSKLLWNSLDEEQQEIVREANRNVVCLGCRSR